MRAPSPTGQRRAERVPVPLSAAECECARRRRCSFSSLPRHSAFTDSSWGLSLHRGRRPFLPSGAAARSPERRRQAVPRPQIRSAAIQHPCFTFPAKMQVCSHSICKCSVFLRKLSHAARLRRYWHQMPNAVAPAANLCVSGARQTNLVRVFLVRQSSLTRCE